MTARRDRYELVLASALMLFVELVLIRWAGAHVTYLSYFSNFVLLGSFLGIGIGFLRGRRREPDLFAWSPVILLAFLAFVAAFPVEVDRSGSSLVFFGASYTQNGLPAWFMLPVIFLSVAAVMTAIAHGVAVRFARFPALDAYRLDIVGSLCGIVAFTALSALGAPPGAWALVIAATFLILLGDARRVIAMVSIAGIVVLLTAHSFRADTRWSPYYRVHFETVDRGGEIGEALLIGVNGIPHQGVMPSDVRLRLEPAYGLPYERVAPSNELENVLIVGAGSGSDAAIALRAGADHVDAVEIDPVIMELGDNHPDRPYDDPRVTRVVDDGRAFLESTDERYDLILFALPDSLTLVAGQSAIRLESYLFTREAFEAARDKLEPGGAFAIYNYYREPWLVDRLAGTLGEVFGGPPCVDLESPDGSYGLSVMTAATDPADLSCGEVWSAAGRDVMEPATDDRPFVYLREPAIPSQYVATLALILLASLVAVRVVGGPFSRMRGTLDLFFMGAAFLLLETKNVTQFALLFGTTWTVNALVFAGILTAVLAAIEVERRWRIERRGLLWVLLFGSLAVAAAVPGSALLGMPAATRFLAATALAFTPIFLSNLLFAGRFRETADPTAAFGANLLGAMVGGALEYFALITGYTALLGLAALLYLAALLAGRRISSRAEPGGDEAPVSSFDGSIGADVGAQG